MKNLITFVAVLLLFSACTDLEDAIPAGPDSGSLQMKRGGHGEDDILAPPNINVTTAPATLITSLTATSGGNVPNSGGGNSVTAKGICYSTSPNPTIENTTVAGGSGSGSFISILYGLAGSTTYYIRAYAINSAGTTYGNQVSFTTYPTPGTLTDIDGNVYSTINIGGQIWMMENLKTTKYSDGTTIPEITDNAAWYGTTSGAYCNFNNNEINVATYGRLYNWYATTDVHKLAPSGWHTPTRAEMDILEGYLGELATRGGKLKEAGFAHWATPNEAADNSSGFKTLPGGQRHSLGDFISLGFIGNFWSSSTDFGWPYWISLVSNSGQLSRPSNIITPDYQKHNGFSVRCVKD